jgi:ABC-2 type transport system ATP-binding protein
METEILFDDVSKFYGEVLGVNRVRLNIPPGITSLVGPNGSGKTTLMNLMTGLIHADRGRIRVRGVDPRDPAKLMRIAGYCTQFDASPRGYTGFELVYHSLLLFGFSPADSQQRAEKAIRRVRLEEAAPRKVAGYSKGMRQRIRLAQSIAHDPTVLILDEPLNGLDPLVRAETIALFREFAAEGRHVILSSHVLSEVDLISDQVILIANGSIVAEGEIRNLRDEITEHPSQFLLACAEPARLAARLFAEDFISEVRLTPARDGVLVLTNNRRALAQCLNAVVMDGHRIESVVPADENVDSLYSYLLGGAAR